MSHEIVLGFVLFCSFYFENNTEDLKPAPHLWCFMKLCHMYEHSSERVLKTGFEMKCKVMYNFVFSCVFSSSGVEDLGMVAFFFFSSALL